MPKKSAVAAAFPATATRLRPPPDLSAEARKEFASLVLSMPSNHFSTADLPMLSMYCKAVCGERRAAAELDAAPVIDGKISPWNAIWLAQLRAATTTARRLKLNPAGYQPTTKSEPEPISYYDLLEQQEGERDGEAN